MCWHQGTGMQLILFEYAYDASLWHGVLLSTSICFSSSRIWRPLQPNAVRPFHHLMIKLWNCKRQILSLSLVLHCMHREVTTDNMGFIASNPHHLNRIQVCTHYSTATQISNIGILTICKACERWSDSHVSSRYEFPFVPRGSRYALGARLNRCGNCEFYDSDYVHAMHNSEWSKLTIYQLWCTYHTSEDIEI